MIAYTREIGKSLLLSNPTFAEIDSIKLILIIL